MQPPTQDWSTASGASADLLRRGGHANFRAALLCQHAAEDRDKAIAAGLGRLARAEIVPLVSTAERSSRT